MLTRFILPSNMSSSGFVVLARGVPDRRDPADALLVGGADGHELVRVDDPPRDRPKFFAFDHHILEWSASASCNERTTSAPSPTADATRFVEPLQIGRAHV